MREVWDRSRDAGKTLNSCVARGDPTSLHKKPLATAFLQTKKSGLVTQSNSLQCEKFLPLTSFTEAGSPRAASSISCSLRCTEGLASPP